LLTSHIKDFQKKKIKLLSIANDSPRLLTKFRDEHNFKVNIIADRGANIAKDYDVYWFAPGGSGHMKVKQAIPSKFLINKQRIIVWRYIGKDKTDRPSIDMMINAIDTDL
jgi:peroxiredoxin